MAAQPQSKWEPTDPDATLSDKDKRLLLSVVMMIATRLVFHHHVYSFGGVVRRQAKGGPIGLQFTSIVARLVMDHWLAMFLTSVTDAGVKVLGAMKYVDDINLVLSMIALGTRWEAGTLVYRKENEEEDRTLGRTVETVTVEAMKSAADSVLPWLGFTCDIPSNHVNQMVPVLDLQVWVRHPVDPEDPESYDSLGWTFFEKKTASSKVLRASSAYNWRSKLTTLSMEVFRRMRNATRQLTRDARVEILKTFVTKMRTSGYVEKTVEGIVTSGLTFYTRKVRIELQGAPPPQPKVRSWDLGLEEAETWSDRMLVLKEERGSRRDPPKGQWLEGAAR